MSDGKFFGIAVIYLILLLATGYITFVQSPALVTLPNERMTEHAGRDTLFKTQLLKDLERARERREELVKQATNAFNVLSARS